MDRFLPWRLCGERGKAEITLTNKEFELLLLAENSNIVFFKERIFDRIWGMDVMGNTATVMVHINRLLENVKEDSALPQMIETI